MSLVFRTPQAEAEYRTTYALVRQLLEQAPSSATWLALASAQADVLLSLREGTRTAMIEVMTAVMVEAAEGGAVAVPRLCQGGSC